MNREQYFDKINSIQSPILLLPDQLRVIANLRINDLTDPTEVYLSFAHNLSKLASDTAKTRAEFITLQCNQIHADDFFEKHRESWGIPKFDEGLITIGDFKNGFLWTFRDHSTSWCEDQVARDWFFKNIEAQFVRHYEFWSCDNGPDEIVLQKSGDYKTILWTIVNDYQDYSALASPVFTKQELQNFYDNFDEDKGDYYKDDLLEMIEENPNW
jgi:hypothetical protein